MESKPNTPVSALVIHCSASPAELDIGAKEITEWHRKRGFFTIGYHYVIRRDGTVETGRDEDQIGAHVLGHNMGTIGICMVGGINGKTKKSENNFSDAQFAALKGLLLDLLKRYPRAEIKGHRDFPGVKKDCPCFDVKLWWEEASECCVK